jgi:hypothetical protein
MLLQLPRSSGQEAALDKYLEELEDPKSPHYHHRLSAHEFGERYGLAQQDLTRITDWLQSHGFAVNLVYRNHILVDFLGRLAKCVKHSTPGFTISKSMARRILPT